VSTPTIPSTPSSPSIGGGGIAYAQAALTFSGVPITDVIRAAGLEGDGLTAPAGVGVWPAATNLCTNGGFETNTTGWAAFTTETIARSTAWAAFGQASLLISPYVGNQYNAGFNVTLPAAGTYVISVTIKVSSDFNKTSVQQSFLNFVNETARGSPTTVTAGNTVRTSRTITVSGAGAGDCLLFVNGTAGSEAGSIAIDGVQIELSSIATPYIETDGGTAARAAGRVQMPVAGLFTATQGWVFVAYKPGWANTGGPNTAPRVFSWGDSDATSQQIIINPASPANVTVNRRNNDGAAAVTIDASETWSASALQSVLSRWTATDIGGSLNGAAIVTGANTSIPTYVTTTADFGTRVGDGLRALGGNILWAATGSGTLTDADAVALNAIGATPPTMSQLRAAVAPAAQVTSLWRGVDTTFEKRSV